MRALAISGLALAGLGFALCRPSAPAWAQAEALTRAPMLIYAGPLYRDFLGCLNCVAADPQSVFNTYSPYGWENSYGSTSRYDVYRRAHGRYSACDPYAAQPPRIVDNTTKFYGYLNIQTKRVDSICGPSGSTGICQALTAMCLRENDPTQQ